MTGLDTEADRFWQWLRASSRETIEEKVLQFVRLRPGPDYEYFLEDLAGETIASVTISAQARNKSGFSPAKLVTDTLLAKVMCESCGQKLFTGEAVVCGTCEAMQAMDLVRMTKELKG